jgi:hypothetical protein
MAGIISILGFFVSLVYETLKGVALILRSFIVIWMFIYLFAVTLGFKGKLSADETNPNRSAVEWVLTCLVGLVPMVVVLVCS